jgi:hypothetical protein
MANSSTDERIFQSHPLPNIDLGNTGPLSTAPSCLGGHARDLARSIFDVGYFPPNREQSQQIFEAKSRNRVTGVDKETFSN